MTTLLKEPVGSSAAPWGAMPGWGVVADLTPPELIEMRRLKVLRKVIGLALAVVVLLCIGGYVFAMLHESGAQGALDRTRDQGADLARATGKYSAVTQLQETKQSIDAQVSQLMTADVDVPTLIDKLRGAAPNTISITSMNVSLSGTGTGTTPLPGTPADEVVIGTVTLSGNARTMADVATYVDDLQKLRGITDVVPGSNSAGTGGTAAWSMTLSITDKLYSHEYDVTTGGTR